MWCWQHKLKVYSACSVQQLVMLNAIQLIGNVSSANIHLQVATERVIISRSEIKTDKKKEKETLRLTSLNIPLRQPCTRLDCSGRRSWAKRQKLRFQREWVSIPNKKHITHLRYKLLKEHHRKFLHARLTFKFSGQNWWPYISMADRKMDSTWLCLSSYDGIWEAINTYETITEWYINLYI